MISQFQTFANAINGLKESLLKGFEANEKEIIKLKMQADGLEEQ